MKKTALIILALLFLSSPIFGGQDLAGELKSFLKKNYPWAEIEISDLRLGPDAPSGIPVAIAVRQGPPGRTIFALTYANGREAGATANVKAFDTVVVSRRPLSRGAVLEKEDVYAAAMDVTRIPKGAVANEEEIVGKHLSRSIGMNMAITESMLNNSSLVKKGQRVVLMARERGFTIRTAGELQQNALVGEYVKVLNIASRRTISGFLVDERTVKVDL